MAGFRRAVFFVLLLTVPFQAALGVSGLVCGAGAHHAQHAASTPHGHDGAAEVGHHHGPDALLAHHDVADEPGPLDPHRADAKCKVCGESCCGAAAMPASAPAVFSPDTFFLVSSFVDPDIDSRAGDGLFRPPRITAV